MGNDNYVSNATMMNYRKEFPNLKHLLGVVSDGLTEQELKGLVKRETERHSALKLEIIRSFEEPRFSWMEVLDHPDIGEIIESETEEEARKFAAAMFLEPAMS